LIDDDGVEFYLSPKDKKNRKKQGLEDLPKRRVTIMDDEPQDFPEKRTVKINSDHNHLETLNLAEVIKY
jgi:hypothetical protein